MRWRNKLEVVSEAHATDHKDNLSEFQVGEPETPSGKSQSAVAPRVAETLVAGLAVEPPRNEWIKPASAAIQTVTGTSPGRLVNAAKTQRRRSDASGATHDRRRVVPPIASAENSVRQSHAESRRTQSSRGDRGNR